jgi:hypothetical protein
VGNLPPEVEQQLVDAKLSAEDWAALGARVLEPSQTSAREAGLAEARRRGYLDDSGRAKR